MVVKTNLAGSTIITITTLFKPHSPASSHTAPNPPYTGTTQGPSPKVQSASTTSLSDAKHRSTACFHARQHTIPNYHSPLKPVRSRIYIIGCCDCIRVILHAVYENSVVVGYITRTDVAAAAMEAGETAGAGRGGGLELVGGGNGGVTVEDREEVRFVGGFAGEEGLGAFGGYP